MVTGGTVIVTGGGQSLASEVLMKIRVVRIVR